MKLLIVVVLVKLAFGAGLWIGWRWRRRLTAEWKDAAHHNLRLAGRIAAERDLLLDVREASRPPWRSV